MELLEVPLIGPILDVTGRVVRIPVRLAGRGLRRLLGLRPAEPKRPPEQQVLEDAISSWLAALKAEAQVLARSEVRDIWSEIVFELESDRYRSELMGRFDRAFTAYQDRMEREVKQRAEALYEKLKENPKKLATMRGANLMVSATSVALVVKTAGLDWSDAVLGPVVAGVWQNMLEWGLGRYLETLRSEMKQVQLQAIRELVESHLEQPVRNLFHGAITAGDLVAARDDFALIKAEATRIAQGDRV
jgi:Skp family chaperone for outer membrane proteins